jgi:hypothetical protein
MLTTGDTKVKTTAIKQQQYQRLQNKQQKILTGCSSAGVTNIPAENRHDKKLGKETKQILGHSPCLVESTVQGLKLEHRTSTNISIEI